MTVLGGTALAGVLGGNGGNEHYLICWKHDGYFIIRKQYVCNDWSYCYIFGIC